MGRGRARRVRWLLLTALTLGCGTAEGGRERAGDEAAIRAASRAFSDAYVTGDLTTLGELYTEDGLALPPGRAVQGREAVRSYFAPGPNRVNLAHAMESERLEVLGDVATDVGMWTNTWRIGDGDPQTATGRYLVVWRRGYDGRWRMQYDMWHRPAS